MKKEVYNQKCAPVSGIEFLNALEMFTVRGGTTPIKPKSRPRDVYDDED